MHVLNGKIVLANGKRATGTQVHRSGLSNAASEF